MNKYIFKTFSLLFISALLYSCVDDEKYVGPATIVSAEISPKTPTSTDNIQVSTVIKDLEGIQSAHLIYIIDGVNTSLEMEKVAEETYSAEIPKQKNNTEITYYIECTNSAGMKSFYPKDAPSKTLSFSVSDVAPPKIFINEISGNEKWIELYNDEDIAINLSGFNIRKDLDTATDWTIPEGITIPAKGFLSWQQGTDPDVSFTWGISAKKDVAFELYNKEGIQLDLFEVKMPDLNSDGNLQTVGRKTDGGTPLIIFLNGGTRDKSNSKGEIK